jgi:hypothetical protein
MSLTRGDIKRITTQRLGEFQGTEAGDDPLLYNDIIQRVVDRIARDTFCFYTTKTAALVANQADYCMPDLIRLKTGVVKDASGNWQPLIIDDLWKFDDIRSYDWRNSTASDPPQYLLTTSSDSTFTFYPTPSTSRTSGYRLEGYFVPGAYWSYDTNGAGVAITDSSIMPLHTDAEEVVLDGVASERAIMFAHTSERAKALYPHYRERFERGVRRLEGITRTFSRSNHRI